MVQAILQVLIVGLFTGLVGIIWMVARDIFGDNHHADNRRQGSASPGYHDGEEPHERSSRQPKADVGALAARREGRARKAQSGREDRMSSQVFVNNPGSSIDEGKVAMTRGVILWVLLMGLVSLEVCQWRIGVPLIIVWISLIGLGGLLWVMILNIFGDDRYADDRRQESASPGHHNGEEPHDRSFWHSKAT